MQLRPVQVISVFVYLTPVTCLITWLASLTHIFFFFVLIIIVTSWLLFIFPVINIRYSYFFFYQHNVLDFPLKSSFTLLLFLCRLYLFGLLPLTTSFANILPLLSSFTLPCSCVGLIYLFSFYIDLSDSFFFF